MVKQKIELIVDVVEDRTHQLRIGACDVLDLLRVAGWEVPEGAEVTFRTPGGGDWSNSDIQLDSDGDSGEQIITVSWKTRVDRTERK